MRVIGLTGSIACGKSTVSARIREYADCRVIDGDQLSRELTSPGGAAIEPIREAFGDRFFLSDGSLNRKALGDLVFSDFRARAQLDQLMAPLLEKLTSERIQEARDAGVTLCFLDYPLLFEKGYDRICDTVWCVYLPRDLQLSRLMARDRLSSREAAARIDAVLSSEEKAARSPVVIDNSGTEEYTLSLLPGLLDAERQKASRTGRRRRSNRTEQGDSESNPVQGILENQADTSDPPGNGWMDWQQKVASDFSELPSSSATSTRSVPTPAYSPRRGNRPQPEQTPSLPSALEGYPPASGGERAAARVVLSSGAGSDISSPAVPTVMERPEAARKKRSGRRVTWMLPAWLVFSLTFAFFVLLGCITAQAMMSAYLTRQAEQHAAEERAIWNRYPLEYQPLVEKYAADYNLQPAFVAAIILNESSFDPLAVSSVGARGLMQLMPDTAEWVAGKLKVNSYTFDRMWDPESNIRFGCWYLNYLSSLFRGDPVCVACAYHAGQGTVTSWLSDPLISSDGITLSLDRLIDGPTKTYAGRVTKAYGIYQVLYYEAASSADSNESAADGTAL